MGAVSLPFVAVCGRFWPLKGSSSVRAACAHPLAKVSVKRPGFSSRSRALLLAVPVWGCCLGQGVSPTNPLNAIVHQSCRWRRTTPWARRQSTTGALFDQHLHPGGIPRPHLFATAGVLTYRAPSESEPPRGLSNSGHCPPSRFASSMPSLPAVSPASLHSAS